MFATTEFLHISPMEQTLLGRAYETLQKNIYDAQGYPWSLHLNKQKLLLKKL